MLMEFLQNLFALNLEWILDFALQNMLWVFILAVIAFYVSDEKKAIPNFALLSLSIMAFIDLLAIMEKMLNVFLVFFVLFSFLMILAKEDKSRYIIVLVFLGIVALPAVL